MAGLAKQLASAELPDLFQLLTGMLPQDIGPAGRTSALPTDPFFTNAPSHAAATEAIAKRLGPNFAQLMGLLQELPSGIAERQEGKPFFQTTGESGFSIPDLMANAAGALSVDPSNRMADLTMLVGLLFGQPGNPTFEQAMAGAPNNPLSRGLSLGPMPAPPSAPRPMPQGWPPQGPPTMMQPQADPMEALWQAILSQSRPNAR